MRYIQKREYNNQLLLSCLSNRNANPPTDSQSAGNRWQKLKNKSAILTLLIDEQYGLCCYGEIRADMYGWDYHIEHVENKSQNPTRTFDYTNLLASAFHSDKLGLSSDVFGGHATGKSSSQPIDMALFISPLERDCANFFLYTSDGKINPHPNLDDNNKQRASYTIDILNLNSAELVTRRENLWKFLENRFDIISELETPEKEWEKEAQIQLYLNSDGKLDSFFSLKRQFFNMFHNTVETVLKKYHNGGLL